MKRLKPPKKTPTKTRPRKRKSRKNPSALADADMLQLVGDMAMGAALMAALRKIASGEITLETEAETQAEACQCNGECPCHTGAQIAGVPCPPDCPNFGNHFDGCHRCDCSPMAIRCSECNRREGSQHRPSCHRQGVVTSASDYRDAMNPPKGGPHA